MKLLIAKRGDTVMILDWGLQDNGEPAIWLDELVSGSDNVFDISYFEDSDDHPLENDGAYLLDVTPRWTGASYFDPIDDELQFEIKHIYATMTLAGVELKIKPEVEFKVPEPINPWTESTEWVCTDPDDNQYGRKVADGVYQFKDDYKDLIIDLNKLSEEKKSKAFNGYGYSKEEIASWDKSTHDWLMAECIFEQK